MTREDKIAWLLSFFSIFFVLVFSLGIALCLKNRLDISQPVWDRFLEIRAEEPVYQRFMANHDFINIIILSFKNPSLENHGWFRFTLLSDKGEVLSEQIFSGYNIGDPSQVRFQFEPINFSKGKEFIIGLESLSQNETQKVGVGIKNDGNLSFFVYYRALDKKEVLRELGADILKRIQNDLFFFIFWALIIILFLGFGIVKLKTKKRKEK